MCSNKSQCGSLPGPVFWILSKSKKMKVGMGTLRRAGVLIGGFVVILWMRLQLYVAAF